MTLNDLLKRASKLTTDNSPTILTAIGATGTVLTAYLTGRATIKALTLVNAESVPNPFMNKKDTFKLVWKCYIPPAIAGVTTVAAIIFANRIGMRRAAAVATAFAISEKAWDEYKTRVVEKLGEKKEQEIHDEIAQAKIERNPPTQIMMMNMKPNSVMCMDGFSGRYFLSDYESLRRAQNDINSQIISEMYASLDDFYDLIGLDSTDVSRDVGWNADKMLELKFTSSLSEFNVPMLVVQFTILPIRGYNRNAW